MMKYNVLGKQITRYILLIAFAAALAVAFVVALSQPARADQDIPSPPPVPDGLQVPAGNKLFLVGHATGTQNYICLPSSSSPSGFAFTLFTPQATLFGEDGEQIITHFFSPNPSPDPSENGKIRATWEDSRDTSMVWAKVADPNTDSSTDTKFVEKGAVAWLKLTVVGTQDGPTGGDRLTVTTFIQRLNTKGGVAPSTGCASLTDVGKTAFEPYRADYFFYKKGGK